MKNLSSSDISKKTERLTFIDGLRGIACLMVFAHHGRGFLYLHRTNSIQDWLYLVGLYGNLGVPIFFVLSGFVMAYSVRNIKIWNFKILINFFLRRLVRLTPPYYISIIISSFFLLIRIKLSKYFHYFPDLITFLSHLFYLEGLLNLNNINVVYWTICIEIQFYLFFGVLCFICYLLSTKYKITNIDIYVFLMTFIISLLRLYYNPDEITVVFFPSWSMFVLGIISFWVFNGRIDFKYGISLFILILILVFCNFNDSLACGNLIYFSIIIASYYGKLTSWLSRPVIQFFGKISFSFYLIHAPLLIFINGFHLRLGLEKTYIMEMLIFLIALALTTLLATIMYYIVEVPAISWSHKVKLKNTQKLLNS
jgi:peptidoglycan/LPS O-acetylase OafA/YrhL